MRPRFRHKVTFDEKREQDSCWCGERFYYEYREGFSRSDWRKELVNHVIEGDNCDWWKAEDRVPQIYGRWSPRPLNKPLGNTSFAGKGYRDLDYEDDAP